MRALLTVFVLLHLLGCTRKYADLGTLHKPSLARNLPTPPFPAFRPTGPDRLGACFNQFLFFSNAEKQKDEYQRQAFQILCPGREWLTDTRVTSHWWTTLLFTRACVELEAGCGTSR